MSDPTDEITAWLVSALVNDADDVEGSGNQLIIHRGGRAFVLHVQLLEVDRELVGFGGFGVDPGDSAALLKLRMVIDDHLPEWQPAADIGDYEALVRKAARICKAAERWRDADEDVNTPPGGTLLDELADAVDEARGRG